VSTTLTPNLQLRVDSSLNADAKYNLAKLDELGAVFLLDSSGDATVRAQGDITFRPEDSSVGGSGSGGNVTFGAADQLLDSVTFHATNLTLGGSLTLEDTATGSTGSLVLSYKSDLSGSLDNTARTLRLDTQGANRNLVLGGDITTTAAFSLTGALDLVSSGYTLTIPGTGTAVLTTSTQTLTNKTIDASSNTLSNITNASIHSSAAIAYSKLNLSTSIVNADVSTSAAIAYSKLNLSSSVVNADISGSAAIAYSKLNLSSSIVNADVSASAAIAYSKLNLSSSIVNADVSASAAIAGTKISPDFGAQHIRTTGQLQVALNASIATKFVANAGQAADITLTLPAAAPATNALLRWNGTALEWTTAAGTGTVTSVAAALSTEADAVFTWSGSPITAAGTLTLDLDTQTANTVLSGPTTGAAAKPTFRVLVSDDIPSLTTSKISDFNTAWDSRLSTKSTTDLAEGTNLYYTAARFNTAFSGKSTTDLSEGTNLYYTAARFNTAYAGKNYAENWTSGTSKTVTHSLGTRDVTVQLYDNVTFETIYVDTVVRTSTTAVDLTTTQAPSGSGWRVLVQANS
jgi:hypothetical protein